MSGVELILRTTAALLLLALTVLLLCGKRRDQTALLGALASLAVFAFVLTSAENAEAWLGPWIYPLTALCVAKAALFWLFARGLFSDGFRIRARHVLVLSGTAAYGLWQQLVLVEREAAGAAMSWETLASLGFEALVLTFVLLALAEAHRGLATDLIERRRRMRILFVAGAGSYLAATVIVQGYNLLLGAQTPALLVAVNLTLIATLGLTGIWSLTQLRVGSWLDPEPSADLQRPLGPAEQRLLAALKDALDRDRIYREEGLTIGSLARRLGTREHVLRTLINQELGFRNFNDFLHAHRIREACARLRRAEEARMPVLSIALDVGYGSIGPFNRAFKARIGMTPTSFRRSALQGAFRTD